MCHPALHWFIDWYTMPMPSYAYALWLYSFSTTCSFLLQLTFSTGKCATLDFTGCTRFSLTGALSRGIHNYFLLVEILIHPAIKLLLDKFRMTELFCLAPEYFAVQAASSFWLPFRAKQCPSILIENYRYDTFIERSCERLNIARRQQMNVEITAKIKRLICCDGHYPSTTRRTTFNYIDWIYHFS